MRAGRYEDEARHTPQAFSPPLIVARTREATPFWRAVFGKIADTLVRQWPELLGELQNRVSGLVPRQAQKLTRC
jgi:hypothetical protein